MGQRGRALIEAEYSASCNVPRILETMTRYFRFPRDFEQMVFLSQIQQGLAIKTAIEYWRSTKPRCMGTLFWQINDTYPVASWASLDYGGQWKLLHYMAKRFYLPVNVVAIPDKESGDLVLKGINDTAAKADVSLEIQAVDVAGKTRVVFTGKSAIAPDAATELARIKLADLKPSEFLFFSWRDRAGKLLGENDYFPQPYKAYDMPAAKVTSRWESTDGAPVLVLKADKPAVFVTATAPVPGYFSDNAVTLFPGRETRLSFTPRSGTKVTQRALAAGLRVRHLRETY